jgi:hypothetical protein
LARRQPGRRERFPGKASSGGFLYCHAPSCGDGVAQLRWTAPADGTVVIGGQVSRTVFAGRDMAFEVEHNDAVVTGVDLPNGIGVDEDDPIQMFRMDGGPEALTFNVTDGDAIDFVTFTTSSGSGHFVRQDVSVFFVEEQGDPIQGSTTDFVDISTLDGGGTTLATGAGLVLYGSIASMVVAGNAFVGAGSESGDGSFMVSQYIPALAGSLFEPTLGPAEFIRGYCNGDGVPSKIDDVLFLLYHNFTGSVTPPCQAACDLNSDGTTTGTADAVVLLVHAFSGGPALEAPYPSCGVGGGSDLELGCESDICP